MITWGGSDALSTGPLQESRSREAQAMLTMMMTMRNMARRITERPVKIKGTETETENFSRGAKKGRWRR